MSRTSEARRAAERAADAPFDAWERREILHPDLQLDAVIREEMKRRDEWDALHGIRVGWHKSSVLGPSGPGNPEWEAWKRSTDPR